MSVPEIDGYTDVVQVARGGFGIVYRARREALDQHVALKVLALADLSDRDRERFQREARAAGNLSWHPNVVAVFDSGITADGHPYLAMEYLDAGTLADRVIADGPLPWADVVVAGIQVAGALSAAHTAGTLHRDLKPENILISPFGEAKLGDFGIAAVEGGARTATGHASYTVTHVAPEILRGQRPDERSDLYGLASTLFTLLTGRTPFAGDDPDEPIATIITRALTEPAPHLTGIPDDLADLLEQTLDKDPDHRPQTAAELGKALQDVQRANGEPVTDLRLARNASAAKPTPDTTATPQGDNRRTIHVAPTPDAEHAEDSNATITIAPPPPPDADSALPPPEKPDTSPPPPDPATGEPRRSKTPLLLGVGIVAVLALVGGAIVALGGDDGGGGGVPANDEPAVVPVDDLLGAEGNPRTGTLTLPHDVVQRIAATDESLWIAGDGGVLNQYEAVSGDLLSSETVMSEKPTRVAATDDATWVFADGESIRRDAITGEILELDGFPGLQDVATADNAVWVLAAGLNSDDKTQLHRLDPDTGRQVDAFDLGPGGGATHYFAVAATAEEVWMVRLGDPTAVQRLDPDTGDVLVSVTDSEVSDVTSYSPHELAIAGSTVWVTNSTVSAPRDGGGLVRIDGSTNDGLGLPVRFTLLAIAVTNSDVWATSSSTTQTSVVQVDPATNAVVGTTPVEGRTADGDTVGPQAIAATNADVWVAAGTTVRHIDPR